MSPVGTTADSAPRSGRPGLRDASQVHAIIVAAMRSRPSRPRSRPRTPASPHPRTQSPLAHFANALMRHAHLISPTARVGERHVRALREGVREVGARRIAAVRVGLRRCEGDSAGAVPARRDAPPGRCQVSGAPRRSRSLNALASRPWARRWSSRGRRCCRRCGTWPSRRRRWPPPGSTDGRAPTTAGRAPRRSTAAAPHALPPPAHGCPRGEDRRLEERSEATSPDRQLPEDPRARLAAGLRVPFCGCDEFAGVRQSLPA